MRGSTSASWCTPGSEAGRRTREARRGTIQCSLAPPQRPPLNLSPPTSPAALQPPPQDALVLLWEQNCDATPVPVWGPLPRASLPAVYAGFCPATAAVPIPRAQDEEEVLRRV
ncbi:hypothetical protein NN561_010504 [Cricetulus griseus]